MTQLTRRKKHRQRNGLVEVQKFLEEEHGISRDKYVFKIMEEKAQPRRPDTEGKDTVVTLCVYKTQGGTLGSTKAILNPYEDTFYGPVGEKEALLRLYELVKNDSSIQLEEVSVAEAQAYLP